MKKNYAVIFAGGTGKRMTCASIPKQFLKAGKKEIIIHTVEHFEKSDKIDGIVISCIESWIGYLKELIESYNMKKIIDIVPGGTTGQLSIYNGLKCLENIADRDSIILIHDGVRPLINVDIIEDNINAAKKYGNAITSVKVNETVIKCPGGNEVEYVYERKPMYTAKAPQTFLYGQILDAHRWALANKKDDYIDSCSLMSCYGEKLFMIEGDYENIKITTDIDYYIFKSIIENRE